VRSGRAIVLTQRVRNPRAARALGLAQLSGGTVLLARPGDVARIAIGRPPAGSHVAVPDWLVRVLGARMAAEGVAQVARPTKLVTTAALVTDCLHALSMVGLSLIRPPYRRVAVIAAVPAVAAAARGAQLVRGVPDLPSPTTP
jgi:hypothetical protein